MIHRHTRPSYRGRANPSYLSEGARHYFAAHTPTGRTRLGV